MDTQVSSPKDNFFITYHNLSKLTLKEYQPILVISLDQTVLITSSQYVTT